MQPPQPSLQQFQTNSGSSINYDEILDVLTSMGQGLQNQAKKLEELKNQMGEIVEFMGQIREQSELSNSTVENSAEDFDTAQTITLENGMELGADPKPSTSSQEEEDKATTSLEEALPQPILDPPPLPQPVPSNTMIRIWFLIA